MASKKEGPILSVDALIEDDQGRILLIIRGVPPFKGKWCLPGGKVEPGERVEAALEREMIEEIGVRIGIRELIGVYSDPDRDPRGHYVSVAFHATVIGGEPSTSKEASDLYWISENDHDIEMGFDHAQILQDWWNRKSEGSVKPSQDKKLKKETPRVRKHPVDPLVVQVRDEGSGEDRAVEDEAGRGKRLVKHTPGSKMNKSSTHMAIPMRGTGTKKTAPVGKSSSLKKST
ncbi:MAG: NUDIX hydrolase [Bacteroidota bacterium]|nr:NUDIX hydrolase [Bacteroidota bacterium]